MRVLLLSSSFGEGHNAAARNVKESIDALHPDAESAIHDVFQEAYGNVYRTIQSAYLAAISRAPAVWSWCFRVLDHTPALKLHVGLYGAATRRLAQIIADFHPTAVVSTYPGCNHLLDLVYKRRLRRPFRTITLITDSLSINSAWHTAFSDAFVVPNAETASVLSSRGISSSRIHAFGFPVPRAIAGLLPSRTGPPKESAPWKVLYMINAATHHAPRIVESVLGIPRVELTAAVGHDARLGVRLSGLAKKLRKPLRIVGWTPQMPELMTSHHVLIGKAGGAATQEALAAGLPQLLVHVVPGQEEGNARLILNRGAALRADSVNNVSSVLTRMLKHDMWTRLHSNALSLGTPKAADQIADFLVSGESAATGTS